MVADKKVLILDKEQIQKKITRIAYQIIEDSFEEETLILVGIADRGYVLAQRLRSALQQISNKPIELMRIDLDKESRTLNAQLDQPLEKVHDQVVILVDDVLNSGRTLAYGMGVFFDIPLKKMRTAVLIDRSHHRFPVFSDFSGLKLSTILKEHVSVNLKELDGGEDAVWLS
jgi:pyrimidine operon attenuation protein/uracil phosphoribosyltransferase